MVQYDIPAVRRKVLGNFGAWAYERICALGFLGAITTAPQQLMAPIVGDHNAWHLPDLSNIDFG